MRRLSLLLALLLAVVLTACSGASSTPAPAASPAGGGQTPTVKPSEAAPAATSQAPAATTPEATKVLPTPDIQKIVKPQPDDWKRGPADAKITIIEWGDFQ